MGLGSVLMAEEEVQRRVAAAMVVTADIDAGGR
jgi:hypothetical protein